ncbi:hypothetical protein CapIbe_005013 [Capra ibex]
MLLVPSGVLVSEFKQLSTRGVCMRTIAIRTTRICCLHIWTRRPNYQENLLPSFFKSLGVKEQIREFSMEVYWPLHLLYTVMGPSDENSYLSVAMRMNTGWPARGRGIMWNGSESYQLKPPLTSQPPDDWPESLAIT